MGFLHFVTFFIFMSFGYHTVNGVSESTLIVEPQLRLPGNVYHIDIGSSATFKCQPINSNEKVEWLNPEGKSLTRAGGRVLAQEHIISGLLDRAPFSVLTITEALVEDTGLWTCRAGDMVQDVPICVLDQFKFVDTKLAYTVAEGRSITLSCQAQGQPDPRIVWYRNEVTISDYEYGSTYKVMAKYNSQGYESLLTIISVKPEDHGIYVCKAIQENPILENCTYSKSINITLNVNYAPVFNDLKDSSNIYADFNSTVILNCSAQGYPIPSRTWFLEINDTLTELKSSFNETETAMTLVADDSTFRHTYKCRANNSLGIAEKGFSLLELVKPENPDEIKVTETVNGIELKLLWKSERAFPIDAIWFQYLRINDTKWNETMLIKSDLNSQFDSDKEIRTRITTAIEGLEESKEYWIRVRLTNKLSTSDWSEPILFKTKSKTKEDELIQFVEATESADQIKQNGENEEVLKKLNDLRFELSRLKKMVFTIVNMCAFFIVCIILILFKTIISKINIVMKKNTQASISNVFAILVLSLMVIFIFILIFITFIYLFYYVSW